MYEENIDLQHNITRPYYSTKVDVKVQIVTIQSSANDKHFANGNHKASS